MSDEEPTQQIEIDALRTSLATAPASPDTLEPETPNDDTLGTARSPMAPVAAADDLARTSEQEAFGLPNEELDDTDIGRTYTGPALEHDEPLTITSTTSALLEEDDVLEVLPEDLIEEEESFVEETDLTTDLLELEESITTTTLTSPFIDAAPSPSPRGEERQPSTSDGKRLRTPSVRPPIRTQHDVEAVADSLEPEERELLEGGRFDTLLLSLQGKLSEAERPSAKAALLLKIAGVLESGMLDPNAAFDTVVQAFELAPDNADVISAVDRVGQATQRIGELAERVRRTLLPAAADDKRVTWLAHLVYWYEHVLGRGREVSAFVSEIERRDKTHPIVLKRAAQLAAMNGDVKSQREHLTRALERTVRNEEKVSLHLGLASAYAGTPEMVKHYERAAELDPTSLVALQGIKRIGKERGDHAKVRWALHRQVEVAPTDAERVDALLELAELEERKFLNRETAAELLERVLEIEPSQPTAVKALERCYHALRDWPNLVRILGLRAEQTFDKKAKTQLLELAAEVYESKLGDVASAVEAYQNLILVAPNHRRALGDLARLCEKIGDWAGFATYKARLAELAPTVRARSQELIKLGDYLDAPDRDALEARAQYERAVAIDPTNAAGWEALQRIASAAGDTERVIECLDRRRKHTEVPRQRAAVLVELGNAHRSRGDDDAARECFEAAIAADSSNEAAALAMLDAYVAEERWREAAPLCELLVNAAVRDRDDDVLFGRLRLATRIATALGDLDRAVVAALAALDARPTDPAAQADLIAVASQCREAPAMLKKLRPRLARIAESAEQLSVGDLVRLATVQRSCGDVDDAVITLEHARDLDPENHDIVAELAEAYLAQADFPRACKLKVDLARSAASADVRFDLLCEAGEIWARRAGELEKALSVFEEARRLRPLDPWLLQTFSWIYGELGDGERLLAVIEELARSEATATVKSEALLTAADLLERRLGDRLRAADVYDRLLDLDPSRLDVFEMLVRTLTEEKAWERLERAYRTMLARVSGDGSSQLEFLLHQQLGLICRDRLGDAARAYDALEAAARLRPDDTQVRKMVVELLVVTDNLESAVARVREAIDRTPHEAELYSELYDLFLRQRAFDKAWCTVNVLSSLRELTTEQRGFHEDYAPMALDRIPGQLLEQAWQSHVFHPDLDPAMSQLLALLTPIVVRMRHAQLRPEQRVGRPFTPAHSHMHEAIRRTFANAAEILAVSPPELLLGEVAARTAFTPAIVSYGALLVAAPVAEAQAGSLVYLAGKRLAEQRPELAARAFFPSVAELTVLLASAVRISRNETARDQAGAALDASFHAALSEDEREAIRSGVLAAAANGPELDVERWFVAADLSSMRTGLLLVGDVAPARDAILAEPTTEPDLSSRDKVGELYKFATSDLYTDLRGAIGVSVQA